MTPTAGTSMTRTRKRRENRELYREPSGACHAAQAQAGAARPDSGPPWLTVRRVPLLAGHPLCDLFPRPVGAREVRRWPVS